MLAVLKETAPDIACLQELTVSHPHHNVGVHVPDFLAKGMGYNCYFKESQTEMFEGELRGFGNAILSRYPISDTRFVYLQEPLDPNIHDADYADEGRAYIEAMLDVGGAPLTVGTTHAAYAHMFEQSVAKVAEASKILAAVADKRERFMFCADLNATPDSLIVTELSKLFQNAGPAFEENTWTNKPFSYKGFDAMSLDWRIDHCFATRDIRINSAKVVQTPHSDHLPILVGFDFT